MLFNSLQFLVFFFALFFVYYYLVPDRYRWAFLLLASCYFYMAYIPAFILILFFLIGVDYFMGGLIARATGPRRKWFLIVSIVANLGTLFFFKYFNFFNENVAYLAQAIHWNYPLILLQIALPLGLSFHVFQSLSYVIEVYRGRQLPERNLGIYTLYVMFFPQLVAGPIERPQHMLPQFHQTHSFDAVSVRHGLELMLWGLFKKLVIADKLSFLVNKVYGNLDSSNSVLIFLAVIAFCYQLYCDFSGYSDIAVGAARVFGYDLTNNFNRPFASRSVSEFWRKWHISLSSWLRDYLFYPLVFRSGEKTRRRHYASLFTTFVLIGLWHGANWTYVVFGALHGGYLVFSLWTAEARKRLSALVGRVIYRPLLKSWQTVATFGLVTVSLIFFRSENVGQALQVLSRLGSVFTDLPGFFLNWRSLFTTGVSGMNLRSVTVSLLAICLLECVQYFQSKKGTPFIFDGKSRALRWAWYYALILSIFFFGYLGAQTFIYFKF